MKKKHLLRSVLAIVLCVLLIGTAIAVGYTISEYQGKKVVIDKDNNMPVVRPNYGSASATVTTENGLTKDEVTLKTEDDSVVAVIPEGTKLNDGVNKVTLSVTEINNGQANVELDVNEEKSSFDVHVEGVASDNQTPIKVYVKEMLPAGLNMGNYKLYHVENGNTVEMTLLGDSEIAHNKFEYDAVSGDVTLYLASFSEIAVVSDTVNAWEGNYDYSWYYTKNADYIIANADQLAAFGAIVGGMNGQTRDGFEGKTVKLVADINIGDKENANEKLIFHPIGYYYTDDKNADGTTGDYYSTVYSFEGTFDGNGHTVKNFYQNTWEIKGDYAGNYYDVAMGLFGYVVNGNVKNLTVDNFSSDGEFTPTGVIAAYAVNSTFENIAITNCNPRVYNTGNGGIVGIGGNSDDPDSYKLTFTNITIDNTNKITALWGSWDVACGGLIGMFRGAGHAYMTNCHVAAQIDVYNDVCGNYQYYWYRYAGMMIGTNKNMITDKDGYTVPETSKFHATNCTVHFGNWNDYYYCELVANSLASYTHDHQFSRLVMVDSIDVEEMTITVDGKTTAIPTSGRHNYVVVTVDGENKTANCYHFVDGKVHNHNDYNGDGIEDFEIVNGESVYVENNRAVYLPFNQLFTGYGWGVKHIPVYNGDDYAFEGITILDREVADSVEKFEQADSTKTTYTTGQTVTLGSIFNVKDDAIINNSGVWVTIEKVDENANVTGIFTFDKEEQNWQDATITFNGTGDVRITIQDYNYCTPTTITVTIKDRDPVEKFDIVMNNGDFLHRVGNIGTVALDKLFKAKEGVTVGTISVTVEAVNGTSASGTYSNNAIQFNGTGVVKITITDNDYCIPTVLYLEVVDAMNATSATSATANNVVLLNDCGFSTITVSGGYTLYGNGFTMTCGSDSAVLDFGYAFVTLENGTLDNIQIVCPNFDYAALYKTNLTSNENRSQTTDRTRYFNAMSGIIAKGNSQILNSRISGGRAAVNVANGNIIIDNSRIEGGAVANILVGSANKLTLRDTTLIQKPYVSTYDSNKTLMGFSVLYMCDSEGKATPTTLEGTLIQNAWAKESDKQYVPSLGQSIVDSVLSQNEYLHDLNNDGTKESVNLGFAYMPESLEDIKVNEPDNIDDSRDESVKAAIPYKIVDVEMSIGGIGKTVYIFSYKNTNGTDESFRTESTYEPNKYSDIITVNYADTTDGITDGKSFGTDGWTFELNVDLDKLNGYAIDFSKLSMSVNGVTVSDYKVNGGTKPTSPIAVIAGGTTYTLTATINGKAYTANFKVTGTETSKESPSLVGTPSYGAGFGVANSYGGDWSAAAPVLDGITIKYWSVADSEYKEFDLSSITFASTGKQNGANNFWEYTHTNNDFTLKLTNTIAIHSGKSVFGMPVVGKDGKLYFTLSSTNGFVGSGTTSRSITIAYEFTDNNGGEILKFTHTWSVPYEKDNQYNYNSFVNDGTMTKLKAPSISDNCLAEGTMITLADGTKKAVEDLRKGDMVMAFDHLTGEIVYKDVIIVIKIYSENNYINTFVFDDGTELRTINEHGIFDLDVNKYVNIDHSNYEQYIGHRFVSIDSNGNIGVKKLVNVISNCDSCYKYDIVTNSTLNYVAEDTLSVTHVLVDVINSFDFGSDLKYDAEKMQSDIETYGLYTYEEWEEYCDISVFEQYQIAVMKVGISKGLYTKEYIIGLINTYVLNDDVQIID